MTDPGRPAEPARDGNSAVTSGPEASTRREALAAAALRLASVSDTPRLDAELLMAEALGIARESMLLQPVEGDVPPAFDGLLQRRLAHEPIAYILGRRAFWTIELEVGPGVLVPRPDSETLIEAAVEHFGARAPGSILDLGTGPGTLLLAALAQWPASSGLGIDCSEPALAFARRNAERLGFSGRAHFQRGNWGEGLEGRFDLVLCNPPYVASNAALPADVSRWEPAGALFAGEEGLDDYRRLAPQLSALLKPGGIACVEIGSGQRNAVTTLFSQQGFTISSRADLNKVARCLVLVIDRE
ncbi:MAG TPA: peptide chain release factor N(5)-glutamine methyltransferase [Allosphingosinicella sp.]|nr:peptide chain release factor N(5)-glutamine methyltransferase [Allosphingosinicella sp.]